MSADSHDPRTRLVREKYFSLRPKPLERWLWSQGVPPAAERVFWLHWQEGHLRGDWCSEIPLKRVALECQLDVSTVTRAYQVLQRMGCLRRTDPGRDPANPFQQATAVTEVRVPRELLVDLDRHPSRRAAGMSREVLDTQGSHDTHDTRPPSNITTATAPHAHSESPATLAPPTAAPEALPADPFAGLGGRARMQALATLTAALSATEQQAYQQALRHHQPHMSFDPDSRLGPEARAQLLQVLANASRRTLTPSTTVAAACAAPATHPDPAGHRRAQPRKLSVFEVARLKRDVQRVTSSLDAPELTRQVIWSIEEGALKRFSPLHAMHIALKKIREGAWSRPHRMPPNWARALRESTPSETCRRA